MAPELRFAQVLDELLADRYRRNRAALAQKASISPSALSQYVRGRATPSLEVLVHLADALDVSLDYLVFGKERSSPGMDVGYFASHLDEGLRRAQRDSANLYELVARVGVRLGDRVREVAEDLLPHVGQAAGTLTAEEVTQVERCSVHTTIVTSSLAMEVLVNPGAEGREGSAPGLFAHTVVENIRENHVYEYFIPQGKELSQAAGLLRQQIIELVELDAKLVDAHLHVTQVTRSCVPGYVVHAVSIPLLQQRAETVFDRVFPFMNTDFTPAGQAFLATVEPASRSYRHFAMLDSEYMPLIRRELTALRRLVARPAQPQSPQSTGDPRRAE